MEHPAQPGLAASLSIVAVALTARALSAGFEAAAVAVGLTRARELAARHGAGRRAAMLERLLADPEPTGATLRLVDTLCILAAGASAAYAGALALPMMGPLVGPILFVVAAGVASVALSASARGLASEYGVAVALALVPFAAALRALLRPVGRAIAAAVARLAGGRARFSLPPPPLEEMERALAEYAGAEGSASSQSTRELIHNVFEFREKVARDVMLPRTDVVAVDIATPVPEIIRILAEEGHSRMPVYKESLDQVVGTLHARDLVPLLAHPELIVLPDLLRPAYFVPWSKPVDLLLREMQKRKLHMGIVVDEYGGVMGICTLEDVLEQIVGEIHDEFEEEGRDLEAHADGTYTVRASMPIAEFNRATGAGLPEDQGYETLGGFLNALAGAIPAVGDRLVYRGWLFTVSDGTPRKVTKVRVARVKRTPTAPGIPAAGAGGARPGMR